MGVNRLQRGIIPRFGEHDARVDNPIHGPELRSMAKLAEEVRFDTMLSHSA